MRAVLFPDSRDSALRLARSYGSTVLIDLDGTLVPTGDVSAGAASRVKALLREFSEAGVDVLIITNRRDEVPDIPARVVTNARKPWTPRSRLGSPSCVLGDQIATDGALAFRLNIPFIKSAADDRLPAVAVAVPGPGAQPGGAVGKEGMTVRRSILAFPSEDEPTDAKWIEHLGVVYGQERTLLTLIATIGSVGGSLVAGLAFNLPNITCTPGASDCLESWQAAIIPVGPLILLQVLLYMYLNAQIVGKYARALERVISGARSPDGSTDDIPPATAHSMRLPALARVLGALYGGESRSLLILRVFFLLVGIVVVGTSLTTIVAILVLLPPTPVKAVAIVFYSTAIGLTVAAYLRGISHDIFPRLWEEATNRDQSEKPPGLNVPTFIGYVLLPRPASLGKIVDSIPAAVAAFMLSWGLEGVDVPWSVLGWALLGLIVYELLLYQTRYLLNDLRDDVAEIGRLTPASDRRNGPPGRLGDGQQVAALLLAGARIVLFGLIFATLPIVGFTEALAIVGLFLMAYVAYEVPRDLWREATAPRPGEPWRDDRRLLSAVSSVTVGLGYGLRALVVLMLVQPEIILTVPGIALCLAFWFAGCAGVTAGWAVEATGVIGNPPGDNPVPGTLLHTSVARKGYLAWAGRRANLLAPSATYGTPHLLLEARGPRLIEHQPWVAPWRIFAALAVGSAIAIQQWDDVSPGKVAFALVLTVIAMTAVLLSGSSRARESFRAATTRQARASHLLVASTVVVALLTGLISWQLGSWGTWAASVWTTFYVLVFKLAASERSSLTGLIRAAEKVRQLVFRDLPMFLGKGLGWALKIAIGRPLTNILIHPPDAGAASTALDDDPEAQ